MFARRRLEGAASMWIRSMTRRASGRHATAWRASGWARKRRKGSSGYVLACVELPDRFSDGGRVMTGVRRIKVWFVLEGGANREI